MTRHRFQSANVSAHSKADTEHEFRYAFRGRRDRDLFLARDFKSLRGRRSSHKDGHGINRMPVSFQAPEKRKAVGWSAVPQNFMCGRSGCHQELDA